MYLKVLLAPDPNPAPRLGLSGQDFGDRGIAGKKALAVGQMGGMKEQSHWRWVEEQNGWAVHVEYGEQARSAKRLGLALWPGVLKERTKKAGGRTWGSQWLFTSRTLGGEGASRCAAQNSPEEQVLQLLLIIDFFMCQPFGERNGGV